MDLHVLTRGHHSVDIDPPGSGANIVLLAPGADSQRATSRLRAFIETAKALPTFPGTVWNDTVWRLSEADPSVARRAHNQQSKTLSFTNLESTEVHNDDAKEPMSEPFVECVKAMVKHRAANRNQGVNNQRVFITGCRDLEKVLRTAGSSDPTQLRRRHFELAEESVKRAMEPTTAYRVSLALAEVARTVDEAEITEGRIGYATGIKRPAAGDRLDEEGQKAGLAKMPSKHALEALADISNAPIDDEERLLLRHVDLLATTGFRIGEALTLPVDCWVEEQQGAEAVDPQSGQVLSHCGIRYWPEKGGEPIVKWLPTAAVDLAWRAVTEIEELCRPAREAARYTDENPGRLLAFAELEPDDLLSAADCETLLGLRPGSFAKSCPRAAYVMGRRSDGSTGGEIRYYRVRDVETALSDRVFSKPLVVRPSGKRQMLSESLSVAFQNQFHPTRGTLKCIARPVTLQQIQDLLGAGEARSEQVGQSAFARRNITDADGKVIRIKTHAFRHWLNTIANDGGLSDVELARWMGRKDIHQNDAYKHGTVAQRVGRAKALIQNGHLVGPVADIASSLPVSERDAFLDAAVEAVHITPFGVCVHNFAATPCKHHLNCLRGCGDYLRQKGNQQERATLLDLRKRTETELAKARDGVTQAEYGASNWVAHQEKTLAGVNAALAVDDDLPQADGEMTPVFPNKPSLGDEPL